MDLAEIAVAFALVVTVLDAISYAAKGPSIIRTARSEKFHCPTWIATAAGPQDHPFLTPS